MLKRCFIFSKTGHTHTLPTLQHHSLTDENLRDLAAVYVEVNGIRQYLSVTVHSSRAGLVYTTHE